ncbi:MAG: hypothetical protein ABIF04_00840, partial [Chloroflexota bacterium]
MDNFELKPEPKAKKRAPIIWIILTTFTLLGSCCLAYYFYTIYSNPYSPFNLFPPIPIPTRYITITPTNTVIPLPPTWTPTPTNRPYPSRTKAPTWTTSPGTATSTVTQTPNTTLTEGTMTVTPTPMPASADFSYVASTSIHAESGCNWIGVGGKVLDLDGNPLQFQTVQLGGTLNNESVDRTAFSGNVPGYDGKSGFEFVLGNHPIASIQKLWIQ